MTTTETTTTAAVTDTTKKPAAAPKFNKIKVLAELKAKQAELKAAHEAKDQKLAKKIRRQIRAIKATLTENHVALPAAKKPVEKPAPKADPKADPKPAAKKAVKGPKTGKALTTKEEVKDEIAAILS